MSPSPHRGSVPDGARLVLATRNRHKVVELRAILADSLAAEGADVDLDRAVVGVDAFPDVADVVESGVTFEENALLKARAVAEATGLPALADDSGLVVDVLGGAPGIFSARWSGRHGDDRANLELLLAQLADVPDEHRAAGFVCAAALVHPGGVEHVELGHLRGSLERAPRGDNGFGYDPVLRVDGDARTLAELEPDEKNAISHRSRALRAIAPALLDVLRG
ncbi:MAG TPA: RdgB/HAM1 family non-canonical purine NTP pyrophosphatase [Actinomycetales bacterium]|nr:RdgB/HAM1 family non-canonical purine NTP pyrophosphatase [Actinomycetales bacterium]